jgi:hypothetical protein
MYLKEKWKCKEHDGTCYCKANQHFPVNWWKQKMWASTIVSLSQHFLMELINNKCQAEKTTTPHDMPDLFHNDDVHPSFPIKTYNHTGPHRQGSDDGESDTACLISAIISLITSLSQNIAPQHQNTLPDISLDAYHVISRQNILKLIHVISAYY